MIIEVETLWLLVYLCSGVCLVCFAGIYSNHFYQNLRKAQELAVSRCLGASTAELDVSCLGKFIEECPEIVVQQVRNLAQSIHLHSQEFSRLQAILLQAGLEKQFIGMLKHRNRMKRMQAAAYLAVLPSVQTIAALEAALQQNSDYHEKLYIGSALADIGAASSIPLLVESLLDAPRWYQNRVSVFLASYGKAFRDFLPSIRERQETEIQSLIIDFATSYIDASLMSYLLDHADSTNRDISYRSIRALGELYTEQINTERFICHPDPVVRNITANALSKLTDRKTLESLLPLLLEAATEDYAVAAISTISRREPRHIEFLCSEFRQAKDDRQRNALARVLSNRIEYLLMRLLTTDGEKAAAIIRDIISCGKINGLIGFINKNKNVELENEILPIIREAMLRDATICYELQLYLRQRVLRKVGFERLTAKPIPRDEQRETSRTIFLSLFLLLAVLLVPGLVAVRHADLLSSLDWYERAKVFLLDFNYFLAFYSATVNTSYLILLAFSFLGASKQLKNWNLKSLSFLFKPRMLPTISIIAPAYQEERTIIDSVNSLLNLKYPNYELIVVNDGSSDETLNSLISYFNLEKVDMVIPRRLQTKPIRGLYVNKDIPKLLVIDKDNGGKADSLNAGINLSRKEYFCGIDADSLLDSEALLKLTSAVIDSKQEVVAIGGNVLPINGCTVKDGMIVNYRIPHSFLARLQTLEYLRSFMAGRLGWAYLRSLLIISGAFGLFRKDRVTEIGGYLTSSERFQKDTVGEDMELVVRLTRHLKEKKLDHRIIYAQQANCWTEVPEQLNVMYRQRDRWQRGLLDILSFHRKMLFNPAYGRTGLVAMPYFLLFEMVGPLLEFQGYLAVAIAAVFGILNMEVALLLFIGSILLGIIVSLCSLLITEQKGEHFSAKEITVLILLAIIESFGIRQLIGFWRVVGYINSLKKPKGWGKMVRKGFSTVPSQERA